MRAWSILWMRAQRLNEGWSILNRRAKRSNEGLEHTVLQMRAQRLDEDLEQSVESIQQMSWSRMQKSIQRYSKGALSKVSAPCALKSDTMLQWAFCCGSFGRLSPIEIICECKLCYPMYLILTSFQNIHNDRSNVILSHKLKIDCLYVVFGFVVLKQ